MQVHLGNLRVGYQYRTGTMRCCSPSLPFPVWLSTRGFSPSRSSCVEDSTLLVGLSSRWRLPPWPQQWHFITCSGAINCSLRLLGPHVLSKLSLWNPWRCCQQITRRRYLCNWFDFWRDRNRMTCLHFWGGALSCYAWTEYQFPFLRRG